MIAPCFESPQYLTGTWKRWLGCHAGCQEVSRCQTTDESQGICNMYHHRSKSKTGVSVTPQKGRMSSKIKIIPTCKPFFSNNQYMCLKISFFFTQFAHLRICYLFIVDESHTLSHCFTSLNVWNVIFRKHCVWDHTVEPLFWIPFE